MQDEEIQLERFKVKVSLFKFVVGTLFLGMIGTAIKCSHDERDLKMKEFDSIGKYAQYALAPDRKRKKDFSQYFAVMSNHPDYVKKWKKYDSLVNIELSDQVLAQQKGYSTLMQLEKARMVDSMKLACTTTHLPKIEIADIKKKNDAREVETIKTEFVIADAQAKILALPIEVNMPKRDEQDNPDDLAKDRLAKAIVDVLRRYNSYCFNSVRIKDWGRKKNVLLAGYSYDEINIMLGRLLAANILITGNCENKALYQINGKSNKLDIF